MEGATATLALLIGLVALVVASVTAVIVVRRDGRPLSSPGLAARSSDVERRVVQLAQRLQTVEAQIDAGSAVSRDGVGSAASTLRTAGVALSHVGLVRFDAFGDTGGAQSFALALIDDDGDGFILTSLHSRQVTRLFLKDVRRGVSDLPLSAEEFRAMGNAGIVPTE